MQSEQIGKILRGLALVTVVLAAYSAQRVLAHSEPADLLPAFIANQFQRFDLLSHGRSADGAVMALWVYLFSALGFGLVAPLWREVNDSGDRQERAQRGAHYSAYNTRQRLWFLDRRVLYPLGGAVGASLLSTLLLRTTNGLGVIVFALMVASVALYLKAGCAAECNTRAADISNRLDYRPLEGWPWLARLLILATVAYTIDWLASPADVDRLSTFAGLVTLGRSSVIDSGVTSVNTLPDVSFTVSTIATRILGDALAGVRMAGLVAGLVTGVAVWLLSDELFRVGRTGDSKCEVFGQTCASNLLLNKTIATSVAVSGLITLYYARAPVVLEGVALGSLGVWALLYGLRTSLIPLLGLSALLLGIGALYGVNGLIFVLVGLATWLGAALLRPQQLKCAFAEGYPTMTVGVMYWVTGLAILLIPLFGGALAGGNFSAYLAMSANLDKTGQAVSAAQSFIPVSRLGLIVSDSIGAILSPSISLSGTNLFGANLSMLAAVIAPVYILGLGVSLINFDKMIGWVLGGWLIIGAAAAVIFARPAAPQWTSLIAMFPAAAITVAFALDRLRASVVVTAGEWACRAAVYGCVALVAGASLLGWVTFYHTSMQHADSASAVGREIRRAVREGEQALAVNSQRWEEWEAHTIEFLAESGRESGQWDVAEAGNLPSEFDSPTWLVIPAGDLASAARVHTLYRDAKLQVRRDIAGNPSAYVYRLAP